MLFRRRLRRIAALAVAVVMMFTAAFFEPQITRANDSTEVETPTDADIVDSGIALLSLGPDISVKSLDKKWASYVTINGTEQGWTGSGLQNGMAITGNHAFLVASDGNEDSIGYCIQSGYNTPPTSYIGYTEQADLSQAGNLGNSWENSASEADYRTGGAIASLIFGYGGEWSDPNAAFWGGVRSYDDGGTYGTYLVSTNSANTAISKENATSVKAVRGLMVAGQVYECTPDEAVVVTGLMAHTAFDKTSVTSITPKTSSNNLTGLYNHLYRQYEWGKAETQNNFAGDWAWMCKDNQTTHGLTTQLTGSGLYAPRMYFDWFIYNPSTGAYDVYFDNAKVDQKYADSNGKVKFKVVYTSGSVCNELLIAPANTSNLTYTVNQTTINGHTNKYVYFNVAEGTGNNVPATVSYGDFKAYKQAYTDGWAGGNTVYRDMFMQEAVITVNASDLQNSSKALKLSVNTGTAATVSPAWDGTYYGIRTYESSSYQDCAFINDIGTKALSGTMTADMEGNGSLEIHKYSDNTDITDGNSCYSLEGAVFGVYKSRNDANAGSNAVATITTDASGNGKASNLGFGTYCIKETKASKGYRLNNIVYTATINSTTPVKVNVPETPGHDPAEILVRKKNASEDVFLEGAVFEIKYYNAQMTTDPATAGYTEERTWYLQTNENGYASLYRSECILPDSDEIYYNDAGLAVIPLGTITVKEVEAPEGYIIDDTVYTFMIEDNPTGIPSVEVLNERTIPNEIQKGRIGVNKKAQKYTWDADSKEYIATWENKSGVTFSVIAAEDIALSEDVTVVTKGAVVDTITTDANGYAQTDDLYVGKYILRETTPTGYIKNDDISVEITLNDTVKTETVNGVTKQYVYKAVDVTNYQQKVEIKVYKTDDSKTVLLEGAKFGLYRADSSLKTKDDYIKSGIKLEEGSTDAKGELVFKNKYPVFDKYVVIELEAPAGYIMTNEVHVLTPEPTSNGIEYVVIEDEFINNEITGQIRITKQAEQFNYNGKEYEPNNIKLQGVTFSVIAAEDIKTDDGAVVAKKGTVVETIKTDANGAAKTSTGLYMGKYILRETTTTGYIKNDDIPVTLSVSDNKASETVNGVAKPYVYKSVNVVNYQQKVEIKVYKTDDTKTVLLEGAKFGLYRADSSLKTKDDYIKSGIKLEEGTTDAKGELVFKNKYPVFDKYVVIELEAPAGYIMNNEVHVLTPEPTSNGIEYIVIEDEFINNEITGQIRITKQAEQFNYNGKEYEPSKINLQGVTFSVIAAEDIKTDDGAVVAKKGAVVETIKTDANGAAKTSTGLYMGKYILRETTPTGYIKNDDIPVTLSISDNKESETVNGTVKPYVYKSVNVVNYQQKVEIKVYKTDDTKTVLLEGAKFGLYKADSSLKTKDDYIKSGIKLEEGITDAKGELVFKNKYPVFDKYVVIELEAPEGYVMSEEIHVLTPTPTADGIEYVVIEDSFINTVEKQAFQIVKYGETKDGGKNPLAGAGFSACNVKDLVQVSEDYNANEGEIIVTSDDGNYYIWDSSKVVILTEDGKTELITNADGYARSIELEYGKYIVRETTVPHQYIPVDEFTVNITQDSREPLPVVELIDEIKITGRIEIHKSGEDRTYNEKLGEFENKEIDLEGIIFEIYAAEDLFTVGGEVAYASGTLVDTVTTDADGNAMSKDTLPLGRYRIHEVNVPEGYLQAEDEYITLDRSCDSVIVVDDEGNETEVVFSVLEVKNILLIPEIKTTAKDSVTLNNVADPDAKTTSIDTISYTNLIPGKEYEIKTVLMDKETKQPLIIDGKEITGTTKYTPIASDGQVDVSVTYNSSLLAGKQVVFFEYIYTDGKLVALHADINDGGQTITYPPETPPTGDGTPIALIVIIMILVGSGIIGMVFFKKRLKKI
ncbi:MAG: VaFE repeat-containing surface-anchored protein [Lachnospiraceae bacterium]|nr:VaFE repeat-containing surface-anchored protein [Lachnospiraceae bacterium]